MPQKPPIPDFDTYTTKAGTVPDFDSYQPPSAPAQPGIARPTVATGPWWNRFGDDPDSGNGMGEPDYSRGLPGHPGEDFAGGVKDIGSGEFSRGTHKLFSGAAKVGSMFVPSALVAAPAATIGAGLAGLAGGKMLRGGADLAGASPDQADVAEDAGNLISAPFGGAAFESPAVRGLMGGAAKGAFNKGAMGLHWLNPLALLKGGIEGGAEGVSGRRWAGPLVNQAFPEPPAPLRPQWEDPGGFMPRQVSGQSIGIPSALPSGKIPGPAGPRFGPDPGPPVRVPWIDPGGFVPASPSAESIGTPATVSLTGRAPGPALPRPIRPRQDPDLWIQQARAQRAAQSGILPVEPMPSADPIYPAGGVFPSGKSVGPKFGNPNAPNPRPIAAPVVSAPPATQGIAPPSAPTMSAEAQAANRTARGLDPAVTQQYQPSRTNARFDKQGNRIDRNGNRLFPGK